MAENVAITPGSGETIAADEYAINSVTVKIQRVKIQVGADGGGTDLTGDATYGADVDVTRMPTAQLKGHGSQIGTDQTATWANSAAQNTTQDIDFTNASELPFEGKIAIAARNPSSVTDLTMIVYNKELSFGGADRYVELARFTVPKNTSAGKYYLVSGVIAPAFRLTFSNDTVLGGSDGFSANIRVRKL